MAFSQLGSRINQILSFRKNGRKRRIQTSRLCIIVRLDTLCYGIWVTVEIGLGGLVVEKK